MFHLFRLWPVPALVILLATASLRASEETCRDETLRYSAELLSQRMSLNADAPRRAYQVQPSTAPTLAQTSQPLIDAVKARLYFAQLGPYPREQEIVPVAPSLEQEEQVAKFFRELEAYRPYSEEISLLQYFVEGNFEIAALIDESDGVHDVNSHRIRMGLLPSRAAGGITFAHTFFHELKHLRDSIEDPFYRRVEEVRDRLVAIITAPHAGKNSATAQRVNNLTNLGYLLKFYGELRANQVIQPTNFLELTFANGYTNEGYALPLPESQLRALGSELFPRLETLLHQQLRLCSMEQEP